MNYFPAFLQLTDKKILLVGGGEIAFEKLEKLLFFTTDILVIAKEYRQETLALIHEQKLHYEVRAYERGDIENMSMVIVAVDDLAVQKSIYEESKDTKCLCNAVDSTEYCDFIFPSFIKEDDLTIAISTSGSSPAFAKHLKNYLKSLLPDGIGAFLQEMKQLRKSLPKGKERMLFLDEKAKEYTTAFKKYR